VIRVAEPWFYSLGTVAYGRGKEKTARSPAQARTRVRVGYAHPWRKEREGGGCPSRPREQRKGSTVQHPDSFFIASHLATAIVSGQILIHTPHARTHPHTPRVLKQTYNYTQTRRPHPWRNHRDHPWCHRRRARRSPSVAPRVRGCSPDSCRRDNKGHGAERSDTEPMARAGVRVGFALHTTRNVVIYDENFMTF